MSLTVVKHITPLGTTFWNTLNDRKLIERMVPISYHQPITLYISYIRFNLHILYLFVINIVVVIQIVIAISFPRTFSINGNSFLDLKTLYTIVWVWKDAVYPIYGVVLTVLIYNALENTFSYMTRKISNSHIPGLLNGYFRSFTTIYPVFSILKDT